MHDIFYFTDIHGMYDLYRAIMDYCKEQDPEATIIFGGDACDRGPHGYKIMKELLNDNQVIYLKGNHEDMFINAASFILNDYHGSFTTNDIINYLYDTQLENIAVSNAIYNGGFQTLQDWMMDRMPTDVLEGLMNLSVILQTDKLDFCHAGGDPKVFLRVAVDEYNAKIPDAGDKFMLLWDRNWLGFGWKPGRTLVFGHTPTIHLAAKYYGQDKATARAHPCKYVGMIDDCLTGEKIDMDTAAAFSGRAYVLNCNTMQAQGFYDADFKNDEIRKHDIEKIEVIQF